MLLKAEENHDYLAEIAKIFDSKLSVPVEPRGVRYTIHEDWVESVPAINHSDNFASQAACLYEQWVESERLFGCLRKSHKGYQLHPGLVHQVNGGVLILSIRTLLSQPQLWLRLKQMVVSRCFRWLSVDESKPLPLNIPEMSLDLRLVLVGDRLELGDLQAIEPELVEHAHYAEFESELTIEQDDDILKWCRYVQYINQASKLPNLADDIWAALLQQAVRYTGHQSQLPLCPVWLRNRLHEAAHYGQESLTATALVQAITTKRWQQGYLRRQARAEIDAGQIYIATEDAVIGQINALSVLQYPGHPEIIGEPSRVTCVAHIGDGGISDVERKVELGGNLHAKGMMIMEAFLISELELEQQLPFSASIVFEQSYGEVDGDSASLAELCVLISALSLQPIFQHIAVTGSVDQFGNIQPVGGVNEKIEGFFDVCQQRGLSGLQGVVLPASNVQNLCLNDEVVAAVREGMFHLWSVDTVADAIPILMGLPLRDDKTLCLLAIIQERIIQASLQDKRRRPLFRWFS